MSAPLPREITDEAAERDQAASEALAGIVAQRPKRTAE
jgi:hypothetical protein